MLTTKDVWKLQNRKVVVHFDEDSGQPDEDSGGLLGSWLGQLSTDVNLLPINYSDWRTFLPHRKDRAWDIIQVTPKLYIFTNITVFYCQLVSCHMYETKLLY